MTDPSKSYDLVLVCGRRPVLLERTLASFCRTVFPAFRFANVLVNIDPFCGTVADGHACADLIRAAFPDAQIFMPDRPGFGAAVIRLWISGVRRYGAGEDVFRTLVTPRSMPLLL